MKPQTIAEAIANARKLGTPTCLMLADEVEALQREVKLLYAHVNDLKEKLEQANKEAKTAHEDLEYFARGN